MEEYIMAKLSELSDSELLDIQQTIKHILEDREISEETVKSTVDLLYKKHSGNLRYTELVIYLEKAGFKRESISKVVIKMWKKYPFFAHGGCPIGEEDTLEHPIYPTYEGIKYNQICYIQPRWETFS